MRAHVWFVCAFIYMDVCNQVNFWNSKCIIHFNEKWNLLKHKVTLEGSKLCYYINKLQAFLSDPRYYYAVFWQAIHVSYVDARDLLCSANLFKNSIFCVTSAKTSKADLECVCIVTSCRTKLQIWQFFHSSLSSTSQNFHRSLYSIA